MVAKGLILGGLALLALSRPRVTVTNAALTSLGDVTDTRSITLLPAAVGPSVEIIGVQVLEDPVVVGTYAKVWVTIRANVGSPFLGDFCRIYDNDTNVLVGVKKNWILFAGEEIVAKYDGIDDWNATMPNKTWNLRIEVGWN